METVQVKHPSFPQVKMNDFIDVEKNIRWQVLCGDKDHWRTGFYSPEAKNLKEIDKLEKHSCPELFMLIEGELELVMFLDNKLQTVKLEKFKPILVDAWHSGFCPKGPFTGKAMVVERDSFMTEYRAIKDFVDTPRIL